MINIVNNKSPRVVVLVEKHQGGMMVFYCVNGSLPHRETDRGTMKLQTAGGVNKYYHVVDSSCS